MLSRRDFNKVRYALLGNGLPLHEQRHASIISSQPSRRKYLGYHISVLGKHVEGLREYCMAVYRHFAGTGNAVDTKVSAKAA